MNPSSDYPMDAAINKHLRPHAVLWALEIRDRGTWVVRASRSYLGDSLRESFDYYRDMCPNTPRRIKAYVRNERP